MTCEQPLDPQRLMNRPGEPQSPGDSGMVDLPGPATELRIDLPVTPVMVEQRISPAPWEKDWEAGECEIWGNDTIIYLHAASHLTKV